MTPLAWMIGASAISWCAVAVLGGSRVNPEALLGMIGPLTSAVGTWVVVARTHAVSPPRVMGVLVAGFIAKMVLFGAYVAVMLRVFGLRPVPFVFSFTSYFIALYVMEALFLWRLLSQGSRSA